jgi:hypothetical protein
MVTGYETRSNPAERGERPDLHQSSTVGGRTGGIYGSAQRDSAQR